MKDFDFLEKSSIMFLITNGGKPPHLIERASAYFCEFAGYNEDSILGKTCKFLQGPLSSKSVRLELDLALSEGKPYACLIQNHKRGGEPFWNQLNITALEDGRLMSVQTDVTSIIPSRNRPESDPLKFLLSKSIFPNANSLNVEVPKYDLSRVQYYKEIGSGSFSTVHQIAVEDVGMFAMKLLNPKFAKLLEVDLEISLMTKLEHPNIIKIEGLIECQSICILSPYYELGTLRHFLEQGKMIEWDITAEQICSGLAYLHSRDPNSSAGRQPDNILEVHSYIYVLKISIVFLKLTNSSKIIPNE